ncbi:3'-5' exonuclease [Flavobacterium agrisoli]|uniref:3'-5' exonuclease n=1 Tax=Flavobacterium agrisoli TaxID=2793066 RepID=A0A934UJ01_9FLAO|nr:3'-5' exonuclease [Flavobacterium agrisoli]MBK0368880.1 3'-5' exonuclease [Flavobacterium agrisoli]
MSIIDKLKFWTSEDEQNELQVPIESCRFVVLDTETTGFDYENDRILCIGALVLQNGIIEINTAFEHYMDQEHYDKNSAHIHGILRSDVLHHRSELQVLQLFLAYLGDSIIVAHHTFFDVTMINKALARHGLPELTNKKLDTAYLYKETLIKSYLFERKDQYSLDDLADKFDISKKDRHTALGDAYITAIAFLKIIKRLKEKKELVLADLFK